MISILEIQTYPTEELLRRENSLLKKQRKILLLIIVGTISLVGIVVTKYNWKNLTNNIPD